MSFVMSLLTVHRNGTTGIIEEEEEEEETDIGILYFHCVLAH
jgi:hypothetical protein